MEAKKYQCGTLLYTTQGLCLVVFWLMVGGFSFTICNLLPGKLLPIPLSDASDPVKAVVLTVIGGVLNMTVCPWVSVSSDRYRSRWGRRIPFILFTLPFWVLSMVLFGYYDAISGYLATRVGFLEGWQPLTVTVAVLGVIMFLFQFFYMFVGSVIWVWGSELTAQVALIATIYLACRMERGCVSTVIPSDSPRRAFRAWRLRRRARAGSTAG